jgi:hypothetical protein
MRKTLMRIILTRKFETVAVRTTIFLGLLVVGYYLGFTIRIFAGNGMP